MIILDLFYQFFMKVSKIFSIKLSFQPIGMMDFLDLSGDLDKGYFIYEKNKFFLKFGRDYFNPGFSSDDRLLFNSLAYPYDQIVCGFLYNNIEVSSFYIMLDELSLLDSLNLYSNENRYLNGHEIKI